MRLPKYPQSLKVDKHDVDIEKKLDDLFLESEDSDYERKRKKKKKKKR